MSKQTLSNDERLMAVVACIVWHQAGGQYYNDLWVLETKTKKWEKLHTYNAPKHRAYHQIVVVAPDASMIGEGNKAVPRLVLFGGFMEVSAPAFTFLDKHVVRDVIMVTIVANI
eukprot:scaffold557532_cov37-Prasinocladus_malaysianus.AAC.1